MTGGPAAGRERIRLILLLGAMITLGPLTIDLYLPALPDIETDLDASSAMVQLTLTGTLIGLSLGQLLVGPLSDALGRRTPLVAGTLLHVAASLACLFAPTIGALTALRVVQGVGAAATAVVTLAIVRDLYTGRDAALLLSRLMLVLGVAPVLAPSLGGAVLAVTTWRGLFGVLALASLALSALGLVALPETLPPERRTARSAAGIGRSYRRLLRDRTLMGLVLVAGFTMAALFAYVSGSSFVLQDEFGLSEQAFGVVFGLGAVFLIGGTQLSARLLQGTTPERLLQRALVAGAVASAVLVVVAVTGIGGLPGVLLPLWVVLGLSGMAMPNAPALALSLHGEAAGTAAALVGAVRFGVGAAAAPLVGVLGNDSVAMALVVAGGMALSLGSMLLVGRSPRLAAASAAADARVAATIAD